MSRYRLAVFGRPIAHSLSPQIHTEFAKQFNLSIRYDKILVVNHFSEAIDEFWSQGGHGANVTVPFKEDAFKWVTEVTERAKYAEAVNTLTLKDSIWQGDNTDGIGLVNDMLSQGISLKNKKILIIGAGGAARGIVFPMLAQNIRELTVTNRTTEKAKRLATAFGIEAIELAIAAQKSYDIIINATSSSLKQEPLEIDAKIFNACEYVYDMMYSDQDIAFLAWARNHGVPKVGDGFGMLAHQAAESFFQWTQLRPDVSLVLKQFRPLLNIS